MPELWGRTRYFWWGSIGGLITAPHPLFFEPVLNIACSMYRGIILHKIPVQGPILGYLVVKNTNIEVSRVPKFLKLKIALHNDQWASATCPEHAPYHNLDVFTTLVCLHHIGLIFVAGVAKNPHLLLARAPLYWTLVRPHISGPYFL